METRDNQVVSQMIEEGLKQRQATEDKARPIGTLEYRVTRWPQGIWEGSYAEYEDAARRVGQFSQATIGLWRWDGEKWDEVW